MEKLVVTKCIDCKWGVIGKYSRLYGGYPIGCEKPEKSKTRYSRRKNSNMVPGSSNRYAFATTIKKTCFESKDED